MTMTRLKISKTLLAVMLTSAVATGSAYAENNAQTTNESAGQKVDSSMNKVGNFMDDSAITAKVKAALVDHDNIKSTDISVKTDQKVVTLSGFVESQAQAEEAVKVAKGVEGVTSVSDKLHVRDAKEGSVKGYAGDTATTSEIKAKLLADDIVRQQFGFDFTGGGGVTRVALHRAFFSVANVQFVADRGHPFNAFRHFHCLFGLSLAFNETAQGHDFLIGFDRDIGALDVVMIHQRRLHFRGDGAVIHEITDFIHRAIDFLPCAFIGSLCVVFRVGRAGRDGRGQHYSQQSFRNLQSCHSHRFIPVCLLVI